jgi:hypothetical protein
MVVELFLESLHGERQVSLGLHGYMTRTRPRSGTPPGLGSQQRQVGDLPCQVTGRDFGRARLAQHDVQLVRFELFLAADQHRQQSRSGVIGLPRLALCRLRVSAYVR